MRVAISFDYDSPAGYRESFGKKDYHPAADLEGTEALLKVLGAQDVKATFAVVGLVALPGEPPDHCPDQIRRIHAAGHEIASHSMYHRFLPPMRSEQLFDDTKASKEALEACIGKSIRGYIPPFNRPSHFPHKGAISFSEFFGLQGRGRGRQSVGTLLNTLHSLGFGWCRVSFRNTFRGIADKLRMTNGYLAEPFLFRGLVAVPLHATGFGDTAVSLVRRYLDTDTLVVLYAHPNQALARATPNVESVELLARFFATFERERAHGKLSFETMAQVECTARQRLGSSQS
jgi:peptidoglycan/xylan/chitin deacetylase (PgdA/CDA1 family)